MQVEKAEFSVFYLFGDGFLGEVCSLTVLTNSWIENSATWKKRSEGNNWDEPGGDYKKENYVVVPYAEADNWEDYDVTDLIKDMITNPDSNYGFTFIAGYENTGRYYTSSEYKGENPKPRMIITYNETTIKNNVNLLMNNGKVLYRINTNGLDIFIPVENEYTVTLFNVKGMEITSFKGRNEAWYTIPKEKVSSNVYILSIVQEHKIYTQKVLLN